MIHREYEKRLGRLAALTSLTANLVETSRFRGSRRITSRQVFQSCRSALIFLLWKKFHKIDAQMSREVESASIYGDALVYSNETETHRCSCGGMSSIAETSGTR